MVQKNGSWNPECVPWKTYRKASYFCGILVDFFSNQPSKTGCSKLLDFARLFDQSEGTAPIFHNPLNPHLLALCVLRLAQQRWVMAYCNANIIPRDYPFLCLSFPWGSPHSGRQPFLEQVKSSRLRARETYCAYCVIKTESQWNHTIFPLRKPEVTLQLHVHSLLLWVILHCWHSVSRRRVAIHYS